MDQILEQCPGTIGIVDDIVAFGRDEAEHDKALQNLMTVSRKYCLVFNAKKCSIKKPQITFFGCVYDKDGIHPEPAKGRDIVNLPEPTNIREPQQFLGMVQYLAPFTTSLSNKTETLRALARKDSEGLSYPNQYSISVLHKLHEGQQSVTRPKTQLRARNYVYWDEISKDIEGNLPRGHPGAPGGTRGTPQCESLRNSIKVLIVVCMLGTLAYLQVLESSTRVQVWVNGGPLKVGIPRFRKVRPIPRPVVYVKTHKTGSTTVTNVLNRYGLANNLSFLLFKGDKAHGHFRQHIPRNVSQVLPPVGVKIGDYDNYRDYDVLTTHVRLLPNLDFLKRLMKNDTKYITVLREPSKQWESAFFFFSCAKKYPGENDSAKVEEFLADPLHNWKSKHRGQCKYYTRNGMWFDLSSKPLHTDKQLVEDTLSTLDETVDLVLVTEHLDESLILLKRLLNIDFSDIMYIKTNVRVHTSDLSEEQRRRIREWNSADVLLYDHYNKTLWRKVAEYGPSFQRDLAFFRDLLQAHYEQCGLTNAVKRKSYYMAHVVSKSESCQSLNFPSAQTIVDRQRFQS
ncbi:galactose-3-O-sulfotransferase 3-like [Diadema setosum]|uniref:galactose-3-O-sulfotransferase 3-like n=1 Tax=Diadema setosum TaxID=31175 RepID=UPI003B3AE34D